MTIKELSSLISVMGNMPSSKKDLNWQIDYQQLVNKLYTMKKYNK